MGWSSSERAVNNDLIASEGPFTPSVAIVNAVFSGFITPNRTFLLNRQAVTVGQSAWRVTNSLIRLLAFQLVLNGIKAIEMPVAPKEMAITARQRKWIVFIVILSKKQ